MKEKKDKFITTFGGLEDLFLELRNSRRKKHGLPPEHRQILVSRTSKEITMLTGLSKSLKVKESKRYYKNT